MPITIQEIIASDTISQLVDKTNFNFDQLLLNGGGPAGPIGPKGPTGPAGGRGPKGSTWYEDTSIVAPGVTPIAVPPTATPLNGDYYLQFNGDVWEYIGTVWLQTTINLEGPTGPTGPAGGFGLTFGTNPVATNENTIYNPQIGTITTGANNTNQGVPSIMIGGLSSTYNPPNPSMAALITNDPDLYTLPVVIEEALSSDIASLMIHQANDTGKSIVFHGGGDGATPNFYEQAVLAELSNISIGIDDRLILGVPKSAAQPLVNMSNLIGFEVSVPKRSSLHTTGQQARFVTGSDSTSYGLANENSNFEIEVGAGNPATFNKFEVTTLSTAVQTTMQMGGDITLSTGQTTNPGLLQFLNGGTNFDVTNASGSGGSFDIKAQGRIVLNTNVVNALVTAPITLTTDDGAIDLVSQGGDLRMQSTTGNIFLNTTSGSGGINLITNPDVTGSGGDILIQAGAPAAVGSAGKVLIASRVDDITLDSKTAGNVEIKTNEELRAYFQGGSHGAIVLGGGLGAVPSLGVPITEPLIIVDSIKTFNADIATPTIQLGLEPRARDSSSSPVSGNFLRYNGGSEIVGTFLPKTAVQPGTVFRFQIENEGALHLRGGVAYDGSGGGSSYNGTINPGSVWMYPQQPTNTNAYPASSGVYSIGNVRLWSTPDPREPSTTPPSGSIGDGISIGLDANLISSQTSATNANTSQSYDPVTGRISLYGKSNFGAPAEYGGTNDLNQNNTNGLYGSGVPGLNTVYAGINVGDKYRSTQSFKVFGDYVGEQFNGTSTGVGKGTMSVGGGTISGLPKSGQNVMYNDAVQMQSIMSGSTFNKNTFQGATGWSAYTLNKGANAMTGDSNVEFAYNYTWNRVGRIVTGGGMIKHRMLNTGNEPGSSSAIWYTDTVTTNMFRNYVEIGPIPFPVQCGEGMSTYDTTLTYDDGWGVGNQALQGTAQGVIDYPPSGQAGTPKITLVNAGTGLNEAALFDMRTSLRTIGGNQATALPAKGYVGIGNDGNDMLGAGTASTGSKYMWIKMFPDNSASPYESPVGDNGGVIPAYIKFTFSYEISAYDKSS